MGKKKQLFNDCYVLESGQLLSVEDKCGSLMGMCHLVASRDNQSKWSGIRSGHDNSKSIETSIAERLKVTELSIRCVIKDLISHNGFSIRKAYLISNKARQNCVIQFWRRCQTRYVASYLFCFLIPKTTTSGATSHNTNDSLNATIMGVMTNRSPEPTDVGLQLLQDHLETVILVETSFYRITLSASPRGTRLRKYTDHFWIEKYYQTHPVYVVVVVV